VSHHGCPSGERDGEVAVLERTRTKRTIRYKVLLHNDDFTTMEFVVEVLVLFFDKSPGEAETIMLEVHFAGAGVAGLYPRDVAETKVAQVTEYARANEMPLRCSMEPE
jgi:ATP-dependent Clp protease adaptor protein ClpS